MPSIYGRVDENYFCALCLHFHSDSHSAKVVIPLNVLITCLFLGGPWPVRVMSSPVELITTLNNFLSVSSNAGFRLRQTYSRDHRK